MKILVVGGAGYIGGIVTDALIKKSIPFTVYDNLLYEHQYLKPVDFIYGDVRDTEKLKKLLPNYTHTIWLAAIVGDAACQVNPALTVAVNQESTKWLAENYDGRIIFTSTCSVYGQHDSLVTENSSLNPLSIYAKTKVQAEKNLGGENSLIFRLGTAFGVSDVHSRLRMDLVVNYMTANALTKGKLSVFGGSQWRPLVHVKDIGETIVNNLDRPVRGIYNLAAENIQIKELAKIISDMTGCKIEYTPQKFEDQRDYHVTTDKAVKDGVFNPNTLRTIQYGVRELMELIKNGRIKYTENDIYFNERHVASLMKNGEFI
jgi:nucleoside-diphosphate-sugar epimerase